MLSKFVHLFLPHHTNNHRPKVLHHSSLLFLTGLFLLANVGINILERKSPHILGYSAQIPPSQIVELTNQRRTSLGLSALTVDERLSDAARRKAADMIAKNYWAHNSPDGTKPWKFILAAGYNYLHAGENLARDFSNPDAVVNAWMNSPSHRENLLNPTYKNIGVAVVDGQLTGSETTLVVQMFGTPQGSAPKVTSGATVVKPVLAAKVETTPTPTPIPEKEEIIPTPTPAPIANTSLFSAFQVTKALSTAFIILIITVLLIDWLVAWQKNLIRISGKNWAHLTYLGLILLLAFIIKQGIIL